MVTVFALAAASVGLGGPPEIAQADVLFCDYPGLGDEARVHLEPAVKTPGSSAFLTADGVELWRTDFAHAGVPSRIALAPDLDDDSFREVRIGFAPDATGDISTWIISGRSGEAMFVISGAMPFDPWADDPLDRNGDGEITTADFFGLDSQGRLRDARVRGHMRSNWSALQERGVLPSNVSRIDHQGRRHAGHRGRGSHHSIAGMPAPPSFQVEYAAFFANSHSVYRDTGSQGAYSRIWLDNNGDGVADNWAAGDIRAPLAYTINSQIKVTPVRFAIDGEISDTATFSVVGEVDDQVVFTSSTAVINVEGDLFATFPASSSHPTGNTIAFWPDWEIEWTVNVDDGQVTPYAAGSTKNDIYIVLEDPTANGQDDDQYLWYLTLLHIGCSHADGEDGTNEAAIVAKVWAAFDKSDPNYEEIERRTDVLEGVAEPQTLAYYRNYRTGQKKLRDFLKSADANGQCTAWTHLFVRSLHVLGIDPGAPSPLLIVKEDAPAIPDGPARMLLIKHWDLTAASTPQDLNPDWHGDGYESINIPVLPRPGGGGLESFWFVGETTYDWIFDDLEDVQGIAGQAMPNPVSLFFSHQIVEIDDVLYDPSYGVTYTSLQDMEDDAIEAYVVYFHGGTALLPLDEPDFNVDLSGDDDGPPDGIPNELNVSTHCLLFMTDLTLSELIGDPVTLPR